MSAVLAETVQPERAGLVAHPLAALFPLIEGAAFQDLVDDIRRFGLRQPIVLYEGQILDGRNRYAACLEAGVPHHTQVYVGDDPLSFVLSTNLHRRHLNESQRGMVAARLAILPKGANQHTPIGAPSQAAAAALLNVGRRTVARAKVVQERADPVIARRVEQGEVALDVAVRLAALPPAAQGLVADLPERELRLATQRLARAAKEEALADRTLAASTSLGSQLYSVLYADPPWRLEPWSRQTGLNKAADNHYPTMDLDAIKDLKIPAAKDAVLFLWATVPMLEEALDVMGAWGFRYATNFCWVKDRAGTGYWNRNQHELLLVGIKGSIPCPAPGEQYCSVQEIARGGHSQKPHAFREMIEEMYPNQKPVELFARAQYAGWDAWGNEVAPCATAPAG